MTNNETEVADILPALQTSLREVDERVGAQLCLSPTRFTYTMSTASKLNYAFPPADGLRAFSLPTLLRSKISAGKRLVISLTSLVSNTPATPSNIPSSQTEITTEYYLGGFKKLASASRVVTHDHSDPGGMIPTHRAINLLGRTMPIRQVHRTSPR